MHVHVDHRRDTKGLWLGKGIGRQGLWNGIMATCCFILSGQESTDPHCLLQFAWTFGSGHAPKLQLHVELWARKLPIRAASFYTVRSDAECN